MDPNRVKVMFNGFSYEMDNITKQIYLNSTDNTGTSYWSLTDGERKQIYDYLKYPRNEERQTEGS